MKLTNADDVPIFRIIPIFAFQVLALPAPNVEAKRLFPKGGFTKTKLRNKMTPSVQAALLHQSNHVKKFRGCITFKPTVQMIDPTQKPIQDESNIFIYYIDIYYANINLAHCE